VLTKNCCSIMVYLLAMSVPQAFSQAPTIFGGGIVNSASFALHPTAVAPGSIAAIFGTNLNNGSTVLFSSFGPDGKLATTLGGASVTVNGIAAPIFYSTPGQLGVQIPVELEGLASASVRVTVAGQTSPPQTAFLDSAGPGIFTFSGDGRGAGAFFHSDGVPVTTEIPFGEARPGQVVSLYATGLGTLTPAGGTGVPATGNQTRTTQTITVTVDGIAAEILFSGAAPGIVGLNQVNFRIPANARLGNAIPVVLSVDSRQSNTATIAIAR